MNKKIIIWVTVLLILLEGVLGLGLKPAKTVIDFVPGLEKEFSFDLVNNDKINFEVKIYAEGDLRDYVKLEKATLSFTKEEESKEVKFNIKLPKVMPSGEMEGSIVVEEVLGEEANPYEMSSKIILKHKLIVKNSYPKKFVKGEISFQEEGEKMSLVVEVKNFGQEDLEKVKGEFQVYDGEEKIDSAETEEEPLGRGETKLLKGEIPKEEVSYGEFDIRAKVFYDGDKLELEKKLVRGEPKIEVLGFEQNFIQGEVNKLNLELLNKWNKRLEKVFVDILVFKEGEKVDGIKTASFDMERGEKKKVEGYFDATNKELGDYEFEVVVNYGERKTVQRFEGSVLNKEEYNKKGESFWRNIIKEKENGKGTKSFVNFYVLMGILLGLILGIYLVFIRKRQITKKEVENKVGGGVEVEEERGKVGEKKVENKEEKKEVKEDGEQIPQSFSKAETEREGVKEKEVKNKEEAKKKEAEKPKEEVKEKKEAWEETVFDKMKRGNK